MEARRRTDLLARPDAEVPDTALERATWATEALAGCGFEAVCALEVVDGGAQSVLWAGAGAAGRIADRAQVVARSVAASGRALKLLTDDDPGAVMPGWRYAAIPVGSTKHGTAVVVVGDRALSLREAQTTATVLAPSDPDGPVGGPCGSVARELAARFDADIVALSLFAQAGMLMNLHVRSGAVLRAWRMPTDTVWGDAAKCGSAMALGDLQHHAGCETLSSLGLTSAAIAGIENGYGLAVGAVGVARRGDLPPDVAGTMIELAAELGPRIMSLRSTTEVPRADATGAVNLRSFAARVGCRRFALYSRTGNVLRLVSAHAEDGSTLVSPPDAYEEQLVIWAAERGIAVAAEHAAAVMVGDDTVLYARDMGKKPMERLRLALQDLRQDPYGKAA